MTNSILTTSLADQLRQPLAERGSDDLHGADSNNMAPRNSQAYVAGDRTTSLLYTTIPEILTNAVNQHGHREAAVFAQTGQRLSYYDLSHAVDELATGFLALGLEPGDRIGIWSPNRVEWLLTQFPSARA